MSNLFALKRIGYGLQTLINQVFSIERSQYICICYTIIIQTYNTLQAL